LFFRGDLLGHFTQAGGGDVHRRFNFREDRASPGIFLGSIPNGIRGLLHSLAGPLDGFIDFFAGFFCGTFFPLAGAQNQHK